MSGILRDGGKQAARPRRRKDLFADWESAEEKVCHLCSAQFEKIVESLGWSNLHDHADLRQSDP